MSKQAVSVRPPKKQHVSVNVNEIKLLRPDPLGVLFDYAITPWRNQQLGPDPKGLNQTNVIGGTQKFTESRR